MSLVSSLFRYGRGFIPDPETHRWTPFAATRAADMRADALPASVDLRPFAPPVFDQGGTSSCVGHALAMAIATACRASGKPLGFVPSPSDIWTMARVLGNLDQGQPKSAPISNLGCAPNEAWRAVKEWGVRPMGPRAPDGRNSDCDTAWTDRKPRLDELEADAKHPIVGMYLIDSEGDEFVADVCRALAIGCPVTFAINADSLGYDGGPFGPQPGAPDHYLCALGYRTDGGRRIVDFPNSWGESWGRGGYADGTEEFIASWYVAYALQVPL